MKSTPNSSQENPKYISVINYGMVKNINSFIKSAVLLTPIALHCGASERSELGEIICRCKYVFLCSML